MHLRGCCRAVSDVPSIVVQMRLSRLLAMAAAAMAWELEGRTLKVYLDVPLEKRQGLPSKVILPIAKVKAMIETWRNEANKKESLECNRSVIMLGEMD